MKQKIMNGYQRVPKWIKGDNSSWNLEEVIIADKYKNLENIEHWKLML